MSSNEELRIIMRLGAWETERLVVLSTVIGNLEEGRDCEER